MNRNATLPASRAAKRIALGMPANPNVGDGRLIVMRPCTEAEMTTIIREEMFMGGIDPAVTTGEGKEMSR